MALIAMGLLMLVSPDKACYSINWINMGWLILGWYDKDCNKMIASVTFYPDICCSNIPDLMKYIIECSTK